MTLPKGWATTKLRHVGQSIGGLTYSPDDVVDDAQDGILVLRSSNIKNGELSFNDNVYVRATIPDNALTREGDILVCVRNGSRGLIGKSALITGAGVGVAHGAFMMLFRAEESAFIYQLFQNREYFRQVHENLGATINSINGSDFLGFRFAFPPKAERAAIADLLSAWDTAIKKSVQLISAKEKRYLALIDRLVLKPASAKVWKIQKLSDVATRVQRRSDGGDHPVLTISNASGFVLQEEKYERYMAGESVKDYTLLRRGEFAYNKGNSLRFQFGCVYQLNTYDEALVPHVYVCFCLHDEVSSSYLRHLFAADYLKAQLGKLVKTGVRNNGLLNIRPDEFMGVTVPIPPLEQQHRIAVILDAARSEIDLLKRQADTYRTQKRGLMQKLLTGQWRVNVSTSRE